MKIYHITCREELPVGGRVFVALGNFDGLHPGHSAILRATLMGAAAKDALPGVFTFLQGKATPLTTLEERLRLFEQAGMKAVWLADFAALREQSPEEFVQTTLSGIGAVGVACGFNFRFGYKASGDEQLLKALCTAQGMDCAVIPPVTVGGVTVSSTEIRRCLSEGDLQSANLLLGRPWSITGSVLHGRAVGGKVLSSPTMNLAPDPSRLLPPFGVYFTECMIDCIDYPAITNLGIRPTFGESELLCETHLLDASGDFYGKEVEVRFLAFHRSEQKFDSPDTLAQVIAHDIASARNYFAHSGEARNCFTEELT